MIPGWLCALRGVVKYIISFSQFTKGEKERERASDMSHGKSDSMHVTWTGIAKVQEGTGKCLK